MPCVPATPARPGPWLSSACPKPTRLRISERQGDLDSHPYPPPQDQAAGRPTHRSVHSCRMDRMESCSTRFSAATLSSPWRASRTAASAAALSASALPGRQAAGTAWHRVRMHHRMDVIARRSRGEQPRSLVCDFTDQTHPGGARGADARVLFKCA
jgi:hypothetical protein